MCRRWFVFILLMGCLWRIDAQGLSGQVSGVVRDQAGAVVPRANVALVHEETSARRETETSVDGSFLFTNLFRGTYSVIVQAPGFRRSEQAGIVLTASERLVLADIKLEIGEVQQAVAVTAEAPRVQSQSAERSGLLTTGQIEALPSRGRDVFNFVRLLPGVTDTTVSEAPGGGVGGMNINGGRKGSVNVTMDGISMLDIGNAGGPLITPPLEAVAEVKVILNGHQAEYGRNAGASINLLIKGGTRDFHGGVAYFKKHEWMNATDFFNNRGGLPKPIVRYDYPTFTFGGPVLLPFTSFNRNRDKVFFFWCTDFLPRKSPTSLVRRTFPTALEREGDFSQTRDTNGALVPIKDPLNNGQAFAGNIIPVSRIDRNGQGLLKVFPLPNTVDPTNTYNALVQDTIHNTRFQHIARLDVNISPKTIFYARGIYGKEKNEGAFQTTMGSSSWPQFDTSFQTTKKALSSTLIHTFTPTLVNELNFGATYNLSHDYARNQATMDANNRVKLGLNLPQFYPANNPDNMLPAASFGGVSNAPTLSIETRWPYAGAFYTFDWWDHLSKIWRSHNFKVGIFIDHNINDKTQYANFNGSYDFSRNVNNPLDSNYAYANAILGSINSYSEASSKPFCHGRFLNVEWFVQDNWKVTSRLTLDYGVRFYRATPTHALGDQLAYFSPDDYRLDQSPKLIEPYLNPSTGTRVGRNPNTGELVPAVKIGTMAPGYGTQFQGMKVVDGVLMKNPPIFVSPRFGFSYDPFGDGKTAIRGSYVMMPDAWRIDMILQQAVNPPLLHNDVAYYTTIRDLLSSPLSVSPNSVTTFETAYNPPYMQHWTFGVQRNIGFGTVIDAAYVGTVGRHLQVQRSLNAVPYGTNFLASSIDKTVAGGKTPLALNFLRPMRGYADITYYEFSGSANYNALQVTANRRFHKNLLFGLAYTWSKWMTYGTSDGDTDVLNPFLGIRSRHYGEAPVSSRHNMVFNYLYSLPKFSKYWSNPATKLVLDNWEISGFTTFRSGTPQGIGYSFVSSTDITGGGGSGVDSRVDVVANANLSKGDRTFSRWFNTDAVRAPSAANYGIGNAPKTYLVGPGVNNWDVMLSKNFRFGPEGRHRVALRGEFYNAFNHTQFSGVDASARFDASGKQTSTSFGQLTSARDARRVQVGLTYNF